MHIYCFLNATNASSIVVYEPEIYPCYKYWFQISNTSLIGSDLSLLWFFLNWYHQNAAHLMNFFKPLAHRFYEEKNGHLLYSIIAKQFHFYTYNTTYSYKSIIFFHFYNICFSLSLSSIFEGKYWIYAFNICPLRHHIK